MSLRLSLLLAGAGIVSLLSAQPATALLQNTESTFFMQTGADRGYAMCPSGDGNLYLAGRRNDLLVFIKMSPDGDILTSRYIDVNLGPQDVAAAIITDSEGNVVVAGNSGEDKPGEGSFVFRYDPATNTIRWAKRLDGDGDLINGLLEDGPGGNYILYGNPHQLGISDDAEILHIDRNTGDIIPGISNRYNLGASDSFNAMVSDESGLFAVGRLTDWDNGNTGYSKMRHTLTKFDPDTGDPVWSLMSHVDSSKTARLYGRDLLLEQDFIISTFSGNDGGDDLGPTYVFLQKTTRDGQLVWVKKYDLEEWYTEFAEEVVSVPDGYVLLGRTLIEDQGWLFLLKTDKNGNPLWAKKFEHEYNNDLIGTAQGQLLALGDYLYFTGYTEHLPTASKMLLVKTDADGLISASCSSLEPTDVSMTEVPDPFSYLVNLEVSPSPATFSDINIPVPADFSLTKLFVCREEGTNDCQDMVDWTLSIDSILCADGRLDLYYTLCNDGGVTATDLVPAVFYGANPLQDAATVLGSYMLDGGLAPGECRSGVLTDIGSSWFPQGLQGVQTIFSFVNVSSSLPTPFSLDTLPATSQAECAYDNNLDSYTLTVNSAAPDLGPDVILCLDEIVVFDAGPGYYSYLWQDGSTGSSVTATDPGTYWVEVTDICGFKQRDSVFFSFSLLPDTQFPDTTVCPGTAVTYSAPGFGAYSWAPNSGLSCTDCPSVTIQPAVTTQYTLYASDSLGCELRDTFVVTVLPQPTRMETIEFCPGESVTLNGVVYTQPGIVMDTLPAVAGCDTLVTYILQYVPLPQPSKITIKCPANISMTIPAGETSAAVPYTSPIASSDCPCGNVGTTLDQGLPGGGDFPVGVTTVCYQAADDCGNTSGCCFTVTIQQLPGDEPCDVKNTPCVKFEILGIFQNPAKQKTYRMRVTNQCNNELVYVAFQLPGGIVADAPASNSAYTTSAGRLYEVRNPNYAPFYSIRFKTIGAGLSGSQSDVFEYTLPPQADPLFIHAVARLNPQTYYEAHLNVFACEVQQVPNRPDAGADGRTNGRIDRVGELAVYPNPASGTLSVRLPALEAEEHWNMTISNALGQSVMTSAGASSFPDLYRIDMPAQCSDGVYQVEFRTSGGQRWVSRFVLRR